MTSRNLLLFVSAAAMLALLTACESGTGGNLPTDSSPPPASSNPPLNPTAPPPPTPPARGETFLGTLQGGMSAIGGETTGWVLRLDEPFTSAKGKSLSSLEVSIERVSETAKAFNGRRVRVTGLVVEKKYVERGMVSVLMASEMRLED